MKLTDSIMDFNGEVFKVDGKPSTIRNILTFILSQADAKKDGDAKYFAYSLILKIQKEDEIIFSSAERRVIKDQVGTLGIPLIVGRIWDELDKDALTERQNS